LHHRRGAGDGGAAVIGIRRRAGVLMTGAVIAALGCEASGVSRPAGRSEWHRSAGRGRSGRPISRPNYVLDNHRSGVARVVVRCEADKQPVRPVLPGHPVGVESSSFGGGVIMHLGGAGFAGICTFGSVNRSA